MNFKWDAPAVNVHTERTYRRILLAKEFLNDTVKDPRAEERIRRQECVVCFYTTRICGQGFTEYTCQMCGSKQQHANTCVPKLCDSCAKTHSLCRHCGADIYLEER